MHLGQPVVVEILASKAGLVCCNYDFEASFALNRAMAVMLSVDRNELFRRFDIVVRVLIDHAISI